MNRSGLWLAVSLGVMVIVALAFSGAGAFSTKVRWNLQKPPRTATIHHCTRDIANSTAEMPIQPALGSFRAIIGTEAAR